MSSYKHWLKINGYKSDENKQISEIGAVAGQEMFKGFCLCNVLKYMIRAEKKNGLEDYKKARHYLEGLIELRRNRDEL